jgi:type IV fimbrial biogenesis protein FimT
MIKQSGVMLLDLLATLTVVAILLTVGIPWIGDLLLNAHMTTHVNQLIRDVHLAKQAAHRRMRTVAICKSSDGRQCRRGGRWKSGWLVFVNTDRDNPPVVDAGERILSTHPGDAASRIGANRNHFIFRPFETRSTNGTVTFCDRRGPARARAVIVSYTGRPRVSTTGPRGRALVCSG